MPTSSTAVRCEPPDVYDAAITKIFTDLKDECADFSDFVVDLIDQLDSLRAEIDRKTTELDQERQSLAQAHAERRNDQRESEVEAGTVDFEQPRGLAEERDELEEELKLVRRRAAERSDTLAKQRREIAEERAEWSGELREIREAVERQTRSLGTGRQLPVQATREVPAATASAPLTAQTTNDPVIDRVMAPFAKLQKDTVSRRRKT